MKLKILLPTHILIDTDVEKIIAEAENGSFCLLPNHIDFVTALIPGILSYKETAGAERFIAIDEGLLVKCNSDVFVSTRDAIQSGLLDTLTKKVEDEFMIMEEDRKRAETALAKMEAKFVNNFLRMNRYG